MTCLQEAAQRQRWGSSGMLAATAGLTLTQAHAASGSSRAAEGARAVGSVHRGKIVGNVVEAWERRSMEEVQGARDPAYFDNFRVRHSPLRPRLRASVCHVSLSARAIQNSHVGGVRCFRSETLWPYASSTFGIHKSWRHLPVCVWRGEEAW